MAGAIRPERATKPVLTHQDDGHTGAAAELKDAYPALRISASQEESPYISGERKNPRLRQAEEMQEHLPQEQKSFGVPFCERLRRVRPVPVDDMLCPGDIFHWCGGCEILATPGRMPGHISIRPLNNDFMVAGGAAAVENGGLGAANPSFALI